MSRIGAAVGLAACVVLGPFIGYLVANTYQGLKPKPVQPVVPQIVVRNEVVVQEKDQCIDSLDCLLLAEAIYHEARGEPKEGQIAVAYVILNRVESIYFPDTIKAVINYRCHFSFRCDGSQDSGVSDMRAFKIALNVASGAIDGKYSDPTNVADHYFNPSKVEPHWSFEYKHVASIGRHAFHRRG